MITLISSQGDFCATAIGCLIEDTEAWSDIVRLVDARKLWWYPIKARALYHLGRKVEAAHACEDESRKSPKDFFRRYLWPSEYLGLALLYEEGGDGRAAERLFKEAEVELRKVGRWQEVLGIYFDAGRLKDVERIAREEDELECAIIAYEAADRPEEAARLYEEIAAKTHPRQPGETSKSEKRTSQSDQRAASNSSETRRCSCGQTLEPNWILCPRCGKGVETVCPCGQKIEPGWKLCPVCGVAVNAQAQP